jgi:aminomethyltransferase
VSDLLTTPLTAWHKEHGAKMAPFAGYEMPIQYEGILAEHHHTRSQASVFDICHMGEFKLRGPKARAALSGLVTQNLETLGPGRCRYGFLLSEAGTVLDDLIIYCLSDEEYMLVVNGARAASDFAWIKARLPEGLFFEDITEITAKIDLQGPASREVLERVFNRDFSFLNYFAFVKCEFEEDPCIVSRTGYTGELGYEFYLREDRALTLWERLLAEAQVKPAGLGARDTLRLELGYPLYGQDLDENHTPAEAGLDVFVKSPANFMGKAGAFLVRTKLIALSVVGRRSARTHDPVLLASGEQVGEVTSGSFAPSLGHAIALAYVRADAANEKNYLIRASRTELEANRTELPFYKDGTARIKF